MVKISKYSIFEYIGTHYLVNPVNTMGVMGKGLALEFSIRYPDYKTSEIKYGGDLQLHKNDKIISFATKESWRNPSKMEWIEKGLKSLKLLIELNDIKHVAIPLIGAKNGQLPQDLVILTIKRVLKDLNVDIIVCLDKIDSKRDTNIVNYIKGLKSTRNYFSLNASYYIKNSNIKRLRDFMNVPYFSKNDYRKLLNIVIIDKKEG